MVNVDFFAVKEDVVFNSGQDKIVGFVDIGSERSPLSDQRPVATHCLQIYIRSIMSRFSRPLMFLATKNISGHELASVVWEAVSALQTKCNFTVSCVIADGNTVNRKMMEEMNNLKLSISYKCLNIYNTKHHIYLISDPPHLLKTTRNNIAASRNGGTKRLQYRELFILWDHFLKVPHMYESDELRCTKLGNAHFALTGYSRMRVCYAAQLLSRSVCQLMRHRGGPEMEGSAWLAGLMNKWFDLMNTRLKYGYNNDLAPYRSIDDPRLNWMSTSFVGELQSWKDSIAATTQAALEKKFLSRQTYVGLLMTSKAMPELIIFLLKNSPPGSYVLSNRINQDPLEAFFGHIRKSGGCNEAPNVDLYGCYHNIISCQKQIKQVKGSNVHQVVDWQNGPLSNAPLPRLRKTRECQKPVAIQ